MIGLRRVGPEVDGELGLDPQQIAPFHGPVVGELVALQQPIDQLAALVGAVVLEELRGLLRRGQGADHVQVRPPQEHLVGAELGRLDAQLLQAGENQLVNPAVGRGGAALSKTLGDFSALAAPWVIAKAATAEIKNIFMVLFQRG